MLAIKKEIQSCGLGHRLQSTELRGIVLKQSADLVDTVMTKTADTDRGEVM